jgi:hypothetical protein
MASGDYYLQKNNGTTIDEKIFTAVAGKAIGFDASLDPVMLDVSLSTHKHSIYVTYTNANDNVDLGTYSLTSPLHIGGTTSTSTLTLQSSSNVVYIATAPAINFNVGANGGTNAMTIFAGGKIAIGSATAPANAKLYLAGGSFLMDNNQTFLTKDTTTGTVSPFHFNNANEMIFGYRSTGTGSYPLKFYTGSAQKMILDANGNLGIGVLSPVSKLHIDGTTATGELTVNTTSTSGSISIASLFAPNAAGDTYFTVGRSLSTANSALIGLSSVGSATKYAFLTTYGRPASDFVVSANGNKGMGVITPTAYLHIKAGTATAGTAPLKLTAGVNTTVVEPGTFEYNGTDLFFSPASTRKTIAFADQLPSSVSITGWNFASNAFGAGVKSNNCLMKWIDNNNCLTASCFVENDDSSIAIGTFSTADGQDSLAIGGSSTALNGAIAMCVNSYSDGLGSVAIGGSSVAIGVGALALGGGADAEGNYSIAVGLTAQVYGSSSIAFGGNCIVRENFSFAFGSANETWGARDIAIGHYAKVDTTVAGMGSTMIAVGMNYNGPTLTQGNTLAILGEYNAAPIPFFVAINKVTATRTLDVGGSIGGNTLQLDIATGTSPIAVTSTTVCTNLNADLLDGNHASAFESALGNPSGDNYVLSSKSSGLRSWVALPEFPTVKVVHATYADEANSGSTVTSVCLKTLPAYTLISEGSWLEMYYAGTGANNSNTKTINVIFGGTTLATFTNNSAVASAWTVNVKVVRETSSILRYTVTINWNAISSVSYTRTTTINANLDIDAKLSIQGTTTGDITAKASTITKFIK